MKTTLLLFLLSFCAFGSRAQDWQTHSQTEQISIQYKLIELNDAHNGIHHSRIVFRYENLTDQEIKISFKRTVTYSDSGSEKLQEKTYTLTIPANSTVEYNDNNSSDKTFYLFAEDKKKSIKSTLVTFDFKDFVIS